MASSNTKSRRIIQNFHLVWLHENIDEVKKNDFGDSITQLGQVINTINTFVDINECMNFITDMKQEQTFLVLSGKLSQTVLSTVHELSQVNSIYILDSNNTLREKLTKQWSKLKDIYADITSLCEKLKNAVKACDQNLISMSFIKKTDETSNKSVNELDCSFMYTQILKEILLTIDFEQVHIDEFLTYCREQFADNSNQLRNIDKIANEYRNHQPIWWYTCNCFLYSMLNRALRLMEVDLIIKMGFFLKDLYNDIVALHSEQFGGQHCPKSFIVYRGQGLSKTDFNKLQQTQDGLLSFNNFLSTSLDRAVSFAFAESVHCAPNMMGVLFEITIDSSILLSPFANIENVSNYEGEEEILISMHSIFRIGQIKHIDGNNQLWQVDLTLTSDNDAELCALTEHIREETYPDKKGWYRLGNLLLKLGQYDKAQQVCDTMLDETTDEIEKATIYHMLGTVKNQQGEYSKALSYYEKAYEIFQRVLPANHPGLDILYSSIGVVYDKLGQYSKALSYYEKDIEIKQKTLPANHPALANSYSNIGLVYDKLGEYSKALSYYEKDLEIKQKTLPANHPDLATSYNNIGGVYDSLGEYSKALSYYEKDLEIKQKTLPANHPDLAFSYNNIGTVYDKFGEYSKALSYYEKAFEIHQKALPPNHPNLAASYNSIGGVYSNMREYSKALAYYEKAFEILQKAHPPNHPDWATFYNKMGWVYHSTGEYSKALSYYEKAFEIIQKALPPNHPDFAASYNSIGGVYSNMREYSKALTYYEKAFEILQKALPPNHLHLATSCNNIGSVHHHMGEYSNALWYFECALNINQGSLPPDHPSIKDLKENIEIVKKKL